MDCTWDAAQATDNLKDHGVGFDEACTVFDDEFAMHIPDDAHSFGERRFRCLGRSRQGRLLFVVYTEPEPDKPHLISARELTRRERRDYESENW